MSNSVPTAEMGPKSDPPYRRQLLVVSVIIGAILLFIAVAILVYLGLRGLGESREPTPTPMPTERVVPTATPPVSPISAPSCETIISSGNVEVSVALPLALGAGSASAIPVVPMVPRQEVWSYPDDLSGQAAWICGTVVNYVVALEPTVENEELLSNLPPGEQLTLELSNGVVLIFGVSERREVAPGAELVTSQQRPRLTLVLPRPGVWEIATADYVAEEGSPSLPATEAFAQVGQAVEINGVQVTLLRGYVAENESAPVGTAYYLTEFSVENIGDASLATDLLSIKLRDSVGNTYLPSPTASGLGESGPLIGQIQPEDGARGSAGFVVPDPLPSGDLTWIFSPRPAAPTVGVAIPYEEPADGVALQPEIEVTDAFLSDDGSVLVVEGQVLNRDTQPLVVERSDVSLNSSAGIGELVTEAPPMPWTIQPGQLQAIELQYQRPDAASVVLNLLGFSFEIGGLQ